MAQHVGLGGLIGLCGIAIIRYFVMEKKKAQERSRWVDELNKSLETRSRYFSALLALKRAKSTRLTASLDCFVIVGFRSIDQDIGLLHWMLRQIEKEIKFELACLTPLEAKDDTYQKDRDELLTGFQFNIEHLLSQVCENGQSRGTNQERLEHLLDINNKAPHLFYAEWNLLDSEDEIKESVRTATQFVSSMLEHTPYENVVELQLMSKRSDEKSDEALRFFHLQSSDRFNIIWLLLAIFASEDSPETQKAKLGRILALEDVENFQWGCATRGCVIL